MKLLHFTTILIMTTTTKALQAYDCQHPRATQKVLDTINPGPCPDPTSDYAEPRDEEMQLIKTNKVWEVQAVACAIFSTKEVSACGFNSLTYGTKTIRWEKSMKISAAECRRAIKASDVIVEGKELPFQTGMQTHHQYMSQGYVAPDGTCETTSFTTDGIHYSQSYEQTFVRILVSRVTGTFDRARGQVKFDNGLRAPMQDGTLWDNEMGIMVWDTESERTCVDNLNVFWSGVGQIRTRHTTKLQGREGAVVLVEPNDQDPRHLGLILGEEVRICGKICYKVTSLETFVVCPFRDGNSQFPTISFAAKDAARNKQLEVQQLISRSDYLHITGHLQSHERFASLVRQTCDVERKTLFNKLQSLSGSGNELSLLDIWGPGYLITRAGSSAAYITKCVPVEVAKATFGNCTYEIPVQAVQTATTFKPEQKTKEVEEQQETRNGEIMFLDSATRILRKYPTIVTCSTAMPVRWRISGSWYCSTPAIIPCTAPEQLHPETTGYHTDAGFTRGMDAAGLMSPEMQAEVRRFQEESSHRDAMTMTVVRNGVINAQGGHFGSTMGVEERNSLTYSIMSKLSPTWLFNLFGMWTTVVLGSLTVGSIVWTILVALARFVTEFAAQGWNGGRTLGRAFASCLGIFWIPRKFYKTIIGTYKPVETRPNKDDPTTEMETLPKYKKYTAPMYPSAPENGQKATEETVRTEDMETGGPLPKWPEDNDDKGASGWKGVLNRLPPHRPGASGKP